MGARRRRGARPRLRQASDRARALCCQPDQVTGKGRRHRVGDAPETGVRPVCLARSVGLALGGGGLGRVTQSKHCPGTTGASRDASVWRKRAPEASPRNTTGGDIKAHKTTLGPAAAENSESSIATWSQGKRCPSVTRVWSRSLRGYPCSVRAAEPLGETRGGRARLSGPGAERASVTCSQPCWCPMAPSTAVSPRTPSISPDPYDRSRGVGTSSLTEAQRCSVICLQDPGGI